MRFFCFHLYILFLFAGTPFQLSAQNFDINTLKELNVNRNTKLDPSMQFISNSEIYVGVGLPISVCIASFVKRDTKLFKKGINMSLALVANTATTFILKRAVNRDRPAVTYPYIHAFESHKNHSFPSGHTSNAFCNATSLSLNFKKWYVVVPAYTWACAVGYSRMHLGMHYPSDVAAGALLGAGSAWVTYKANKWLENYYKRKYSVDKTNE